jgi:hypothetical protein
MLLRCEAVMVVNVSFDSVSCVVSSVSQFRTSSTLDGGLTGGQGDAVSAIVVPIQEQPASRSALRGRHMERTEALNTLRREYQSDYQKEIRATRDLLSTGVRLMQGSEGTVNFTDKVTFVSLGQARKRFVDAIGPAIKPLLEAYARELEREAASLGLDGQATSDAPLMESLHDVLRHLQHRGAETPAYPPRAMVGNGYGQRESA